MWPRHITQLHRIKFSVTDIVLAFCFVLFKWHIWSQWLQNYTCVCHDGYTGVNCEFDVDECQSSPCQHNATCWQRSDQNRSDFSYAAAAGFDCLCVPGFTGNWIEVSVWFAFIIVIISTFIVIIVIGKVATSVLTKHFVCTWAMAPFDIHCAVRWWKHMVVVVLCQGAITVSVLCTVNGPWFSPCQRYIRP